MYHHRLRIYASKEMLPKESQLAYQLARIAVDDVGVDRDVTEMIISRLIDNASVAIAAINRISVANARSQALAYSREDGATVFGMPNDQLFDAPWAAWANGTAVRELDMHDTFQAADYAHPGDNIPPILAVAQQCNCSGSDIVRALATAYEVHVNLVKGICLHTHNIDHIAHLGPAAAAGIGTLLRLDSDAIYQAIQHAVHVTCSTRQSRKGEISSWKAYAPAHAGKLAIEAVDRAMRGEKSPSPIYEGEDSLIVSLLDGPGHEYLVPLPEPGEPKRAIMETYTKEHAAEYQSQALIDLAFGMRDKIESFEDIESIVIHTSHHTHYVIGTGAGDPQKMDPRASRETLDHSIMYIFAVALQDGRWHHVESYRPQRSTREDTVRLWQKISTKEDPIWTERYHEPDPDKKSFGARVAIHFKNSEVLEDEINVANAHPSGTLPFSRLEYLFKFNTLTEEIIDPFERDRFVDLVQNLPALDAEEVKQINVQVADDCLNNSQRDRSGIF